MSKNLPNARGFFNLVNVYPEGLRIAGWMFHPQIAMDSFKVFIDGQLQLEQPLVENTAVADTFPFVAHALKSEFNVLLPYDKKLGLLDIVVVGCVAGVETAKITTWFSENINTDYPFPDNLKTRVANNTNIHFFRASSFTSFRNYYEQVQRFAKPGSLKNMLDWGCGCGRISVMFENATDIKAVYGGDIDGESIAWCKENLKGQYDVTPLFPPTKYADNFFELVISNAVFTHLTKDVQQQWLAEMQRIVAPGGLFIASVHGEFATFFNFNGEVEETLTNDINDSTIDKSLAGVVPDGYYRGTHQKKTYTEQVFSQYFEILDYIEAGAGNFQDLVVMKKAATKGFVNTLSQPKSPSRFKKSSKRKK